MFMKGKHSDAVVGFQMDNFETRQNKTELVMGSQDDLMKPHKDEDGEKQYSIRYLFLDYCEYTSGHGPPRILASKQLIRKIYWLVLFVAALAVSLWQISSLFKKFEARPLATHVSLKHETVSKENCSCEEKPILLFNSNQSWSQDFEVVLDRFSEAYLVVKTCDRFFLFLFR